MRKLSLFLILFLVFASFSLAVEKNIETVDTIDVVKDEDTFTSEELEESVETYCNDKPKCNETDNGLDIYNKGTTTYNNHQYTDRCIGKKDLYLKEYYCSYDHKKVKIVRCENGCSNGACIPDEVPEFGTAAALIALMGSLGIFTLIRRKH